MNETGENKINPQSDIGLPIFVGTDYVSQWIDGITDEIYHSDTSAVSSTRLKRILKSPMSYRHSLVETPKDSDAMQLGRLVHQAILEPHRFNPVVMPELGDMRSSKNRELRDAWLREHDGKLILDAKTHEQVSGIRDQVLRHKYVQALLIGGRYEVAGYYRDRETGLKCRIKPDVWNPRRELLIDIKTTRDCRERDFMRAIAEYGYHFQMAMYGTGIFEITGKRPEYYVWIAVETQAPYEVSVHVADPGVIVKGLELYERAILKLKQCIEKNDWPGMQERLSIINLPAWALNE